METSSKPVVLIIGTLDTKLQEVLYIRAQILASSNANVQTRVLDVSGKYSDSDTLAGIPASELITPLLEVADDLLSMQRDEYVNAAIDRCIPLIQQLIRDSVIQGTISAAGYWGSSLATTLMRKACPIGFPKVMVSTVASGDVRPYIEETDILMMHSVVDVWGLNSTLKTILSNAAGAIAGMVSASVLRQKEDQGKKKIERIAVNMFRVTTPCVEMIRSILTSTPDVSEREILVFHAAGPGGRAMERLVREDQVDAVIDLTTTEIPDELMQGICSAGPERLEAAVKRGIPLIVSVGACDVVNFGPKEMVPKKYIDRNLFVASPTVTVMRTNVEENKEIARYIASKLKAAGDPSMIRVMLPRGGVSLLDMEGQPFHDPEADSALFETLISELDGTNIEIIDCAEDINMEAFARKVCENILELVAHNSHHLAGSPDAILRSLLKFKNDRGEMDHYREQILTSAVPMSQFA